LVRRFVPVAGSMSAMDDIRDRVQWVQDGRALERAAIVKDLLAMALAFAELHDRIEASLCRSLAGRYDRGDHLKEDNHG
jgi:hypothetical protein